MRDSEDRAYDGFEGSLEERVRQLELENDILRAAAKVLKAESPSAMANREKALVINELRATTGRSSRELTGSLRIRRAPMSTSERRSAGRTGTPGCGRACARRSRARAPRAATATSRTRCGRGTTRSRCPRRWCAASCAKRGWRSRTLRGGRGTARTRARYPMRPRTWSTAPSEPCPEGQAIG